MAAVKGTISQRSFMQGEIREDFLEGDDLDIRRASLKGASNIRTLSTRGVEARPGTYWIRALTDAENIFEVTPATGLSFGVLLNDTSLEVIDSTGQIVFSTTGVPWTRADTLWLEDFRETIVIGGEGIAMHNLSYSDGAWAFSLLSYDDAPGGELAQPYWAFEKTIKMQPSATTGDISITTTAPFWVTSHVGQRFRYGQREILITERQTGTLAKGTVINNLPPSFSITVEDASEFRVGEAVVGADTNYQGLVRSVSGNVLSVVTVSFFEGPDVDEELSGPSGSSKVTASAEIAPLSSGIWDEPLFSVTRGYPRAAGVVAGRLILLDHPLVPDLIVASSTRSIHDFEAGANDDDAIIRQIGDNSPRFLHAVNAGDLLLFSDRGSYYVEARGNTEITPSSFNARRFDQRGANNVKPVLVNDGVVFVEASGEHVAAALLTGNVQLQWSVRTISIYHNHQIKSPKRLCGAPLDRSQPEQYLFVVNGDGTLAVVSYDSTLAEESVGFVPWSTEGSFVNVSPFLGSYWAIVDRTVNGATARYLERFDESAVMDSTVIASSESAFSNLVVNGADLEVNGVSLTATKPVAAHLGRMSASIYADGFFAGNFVVNDDGIIAGEPDIDGEREIGLHFDSEMTLWPQEAIESERHGMLKARVIRVSVSVQDTSPFQVITNGTAREFAGYKAGDDLSIAPPLRTQVYKVPVFGTRYHPDIKIKKHQPGKFRVLKTTQEVQG